MPAVLVWILPLHSASTFSVLLVRVVYLSNYQFLPKASGCACVPRAILVLELDSTHRMNTTPLHEPRARSLTRFPPH